MKFPAMFSPIRIGTVTVPNRFVVPPMGNNFANTDGSLSDRSLGYYQARAKGGFGLITIESTVVYQEAKGGPRKPCLFSDDTVESFRRVADACHAYGAKVSIQLQHAGPEGSAALTGFSLKAASAMPASSSRTSAARPAATSPSSAASTPATRWKAVRASRTPPPWPRTSSRSAAWTPST